MRICIIAISDPWQHSHGGTLRTRAFADALAHLGHEVCCVYPSSEPSPGPSNGVDRVAVPATSLGNRTWPGWVRAAKRAVLPMPTQAGARSPALLAEVRGREPEVVLVSQLSFASYGEQVPGASLWLDHSDLWSDFIQREIAARSGLPRWAARRQQRRLVGQEVCSSRSASMSTAAGWADAQLLGQRLGEEVAWLPTPVAAPSASRGSRSATAPVAGFLANFGFWPNVDALDLLNEVWAPRLLAMGWRVVVAGLGSDKVEVAAGIEVMGSVQDVRSFYDAVDVTLAPIRLGGGMKVKVVESLVHSRPVVGTPFAVAGFPAPFAAAISTVDPEEPAFDALLAGPPRLPPDLPTLLQPFTTEGFRQRVGELTERLP